eukprot:6124140-Pleurochrysis_carterae.AAC.4
MQPYLVDHRLARNGLAFFVLLAAPFVSCDIRILATVFQRGDANISCYRIPAVVQTGTGVLVAFAEARHGSCEDAHVHEIAMRRSFDGGHTWSQLRLIAGNASVRAGNPAVVFDQRDQKIVLLCHLFRTDGGPENGVIFSDDDGFTWSTMRGMDFGYSPGLMTGPGAGLQTSDGRLLIPTWQGRFVQEVFTLLIFSDDGGKSWTPINQTFPTMNEAALTQLPNGSVLINMRHEREAKLGRGVAVSNDGGLTFGPVHFEEMLPGPVCQASIVTIGGATYFSNPATNESRGNLTIRMSTDDCRTWPSALLVSTRASAGYSCL